MKTAGSWSFEVQKASGGCGGEGEWGEAMNISEAEAKTGGKEEGREGRGWGALRDLERQMSAMGEGLFERVGNPARERGGQ